MHTCRHCGEEILPEDNFCGHCGQALTPFTIRPEAGKETAAAGRTCIPQSARAAPAPSNAPAYDKDIRDGEQTLMPAGGVTVKNLSLHDIRLNLARVYLRQGNYSRVVEECDRILQQTPDHEEARALREQAMKLGDTVSFEELSEDMS